MACPNTRKFSAWVNNMPGVRPKLIVSGEVETAAGNLVPQLSEAVPQGINPEILLLKLEIVKDGDVGTADVSFRDVRFEKAVKPDTYTLVQVIYGSEGCLTLDVNIAS